MLLRPCSGDSPPRLAIGNGALPVPTGLMKPQQESGIFCAFQALRVLTGITRIPAVPACISGLVGVVAVFFLFVVSCVWLIPVPTS